MRCAVFGCKNDNLSKNFDKSIRFHSFPKDSVTQKQWVEACCRKDNFNCATARICSKHFGIKDFERNLQQELLGYQSKKGLKLKSEAIPSLNLPNHEKCLDGAQQWKSKNLVEKLLTSQPCTFRIISTKAIAFEEQELNGSSINSAAIASTAKSIGLNTDPTKETLELSQMKKENVLLRIQVNELLQIKTAVEKIFTKRQVKRLQNPNVRTVWSVEEISRGIAIHAAGSKAYCLLLKMGYPLPPISILKRWRKNI